MGFFQTFPRDLRSKRRTFKPPGLLQIDLSRSIEAVDSLTINFIFLKYRKHVPMISMIQMPNALCPS